MRHVVCGLLALCLAAPGLLAPAPAVVPPIQAAPRLPDASDPLPPAQEPDDPWPRLTLRAEYLLWWLRDMPLRPLLTTGDTTDTLPGALGMPTATVLYPVKEVDLGLFSGARLLAAYRFGSDESFAVEAGGFLLGSRTQDYFASSDGSFNSKVIGRPFYNLGSDQSDVSLTAFPSVASGAARVTTTARVLGAEANGLATLYRYRGLRFDALAGFRYFRLYESVVIDEQSTVLAGVPVMGGTQFLGRDDFAVSNNFYGGQLGLRTELRNGRLMLEAQGKVALGGTQETLTISGFTRCQSAGGPVEVLPGNLYALSSNIGRHSRGAFAVLPEGSVNVGWEVFDHVQFQVGYTFLYVSRVLRAGPQIDTGLNPNLIPSSVLYGTPGGPARPAAPLAEEGFWVQGINAGVEVRF